MASPHEPPAAPPPAGSFRTWTTGYLPWISAILSVLSARVFASGAAFLSNVLVARYLGPEDFNSFYLLFAIMTIVAGLTGPAIDTSLVRFAVKQITPERDGSAPYFKFVL
ncbi:MAG: oligosaccharide flippase family protein, partial [Candidatus Hydrogenedentes bacterium]|nr:oligosaccharide flippase family protein [Candidatus Hydrogenedentota bacterium]